MPLKESAAIWNPFTAKSRAEQSAREMYPGKAGQDDQRDAARHMLASGYLSKAWGPGIADLIGKAYEFKETPLRHLGALAGVSNYRYDRPIDLHNNATGIELAQKAGDMEEFERLVNAAAERARPTQTPGTPWVPARREAEEMRKGSAQYADGGPVTLDHTQPDMADGGRILPDPNLYAKGGLVAGFADGGAATGFFPQMKPRRSKQDREAAKDMPVAAARGALAGMLGAPGDIESLIRMLPGLDESRTVLPTSEDIERRLPFKEASATPAGRAATGLGTLAGGFYTGPGAPVRLMGALPGALRHGAGEFAQAAAQSGPNVVKPEGGNWLAGAIQRGTSGLKSRVRTPGVNEHTEANAAADTAINKWIDGNLGNYLQKQMATPSDPVRALAEEGITHLRSIADDAPRSMHRPSIYPSDALRLRREKAGFPALGSGVSDLAKRWENIADESIFTHRAGDIQESMQSGKNFEAAKAAYEEKMVEIDAAMAERLAARGFNEDEAATMLRVMTPRQKAEIVGDEGLEAVIGAYERASIDSQSVNKMIGEQNPWIAKLDPDAPAYHGDVYDLGFDHVIDVLKEDLAAGRIRPEQLNKVSIEQAVRRTYEYDLQMAEKMNAARAAAREGLPVYKEYPEGYKWVELNKPGAFATESEAMGHSVRGYEPPRGHADWIEGSGDSGSSGYGHGGWDAIKEGRAKVYSLVDPKGEPHVTIEVKGGKKLGEKDLPDDVRDELAEAYGDRSREEFEAAVAKYFEGKNIPEMITQIKGKQNRAPKEEYLPFVQDFVKSGQWGDVGDLHNTGLMESRFDADTLKRYGKEYQKYVTQQELDDIMRAIDESAQKGSQGYAGGGSVKTGVKEGVNLLRRSLFGLKPSQEMAGRELAPVQRDLDRMQAELNRAGKAAPKVEERTVSIDPGKGSAKVTDTLQKVAETPVSRRTVLKSATGQVMQHALPAHSFADLMKPAEVAKQAVEAVAPVASASAVVPGLMAKALKMGLDEDAAMRFVAENLPKGLQGADDFDIGTMHYLLRNPSEYIAEGADKWTDLPPTRLNIMSDFLQQPTDESPFSIRGALRNVRRENPEMYKELRETVRDIKDYGFEN